MLHFTSGGLERRPPPSRALPWATSFHYAFFAYLIFMRRSGRAPPLRLAPCSLGAGAPILLWGCAPMPPSGMKKPPSLAAASGEIFLNVVFSGVYVIIQCYGRLFSPPLFDQVVDESTFVLDFSQNLKCLFVSPKRHHLRCSFAVLGALLAQLLLFFLFHVILVLWVGACAPSQVS